MSIAESKTSRRVPRSVDKQRTTASFADDKNSRKTIFCVISGLNGDFFVNCIEEKTVLENTL